MKYIDADRLKAEIERRKQSLRVGICSDDAFTREQKKEMLIASEEIDRFNRIVTSLQQEQPVWKPTEEQMEALEYVIRDYREDSCNATANYLQEILDNLKNM